MSSMESVADKRIIKEIFPSVFVTIGLLKACRNQLRKIEYMYYVGIWFVKEIFVKTLKFDKTSE